MASPPKGKSQGQDRYESSDEDSWTTSRQPLLSTMSWGWSEDGRCKLCGLIRFEL